MDSFEQNNYVPSIFTVFTDASRADELEAYVKKHISEEAMQKATETAESIRHKAAIKKRELGVIDKWVEEHRSRSK